MIITSKMEVTQKLKKIVRNKWMLRNIFTTIFFNFHYLPLKQAWKLPIILYKPSLGELKGEVIIDSRVKIRPGLIKLGQKTVSLYNSNGVTFENHGGVVVFKGSSKFDSGVRFSIGERGLLEIGKDVDSTAETKIVCYHHIKIDDEVLIGWDCLFMDTDLHQLSSSTDDIPPIAFGKVFVGRNTWIASKCDIMKDTFIPANSIVAFRSMTNHNYGNRENVLIAGCPAKIVKNNIYLNKKEWDISYPVVDFF